MVQLRRAWDKRKRSGRFALAAYVAVALCCSVAMGQRADLQRLERQLEQVRRDTRLRVDPDAPLGQRTLFQYGAYVSLEYLSLDDQNNLNHTLWQPQLFVYSRLNLDGVHDLFLRGRTGYRDFGAGDEFTDEDDEWLDGKLERAVYRFDLQRYVAATRGVAVDHNVTVTAGRDLVYWANGLALNQVLDGAQVDFTKANVTFTLLAGRTDPDIVDFDFSRPGFDDETTRMYYGAMLRSRLGTHRPYIYALVQRDENPDNPLVITSPASDGSGGTINLVTNFDYDSYYLGIGADGALGDRWVYGVELVYEGGETLSNSFTVTDAGTFAPLDAQTEDAIEALALDLRLDYLLPDRRQTRFSGELILASGDSDRASTSNTFGGNRTGTHDHAFNSLGLLNTGIAFNPSVSNLALLRVGASTLPAPQFAPFRRLQVGVDFFVFCKTMSSAPIDEPTLDRRYLGVEPDLFLNWRITSDVSLALRYGVFFPGSAFFDNEIRQTFYGGVTIAF